MNAEVIIENGLVVIPPSSVPEVFASEESITTIVNMIKGEVAGHTPDLTTLKGRKAIASLAMSVSKSKVVLDNLGKELVSDWKVKAKLVDSARKIARDSLDELRDEVRNPLTAWEAEQDRIALEEQAERERIAEEQSLAAEVLRCQEEAIALDELFVLRKKQEESERVERERQQKERDDIARKEREDRLVQEERERVQREAADKIREEQEIADRRVRQAEEDARKIIQDEADRVAREQREAARIIEEKKAQQELLKAEAERKANLKRNRTTKKRQAAKSLVELTGITKERADSIVEAIASGQVENISIQY